VSIRPLTSVSAQHLEAMHAARAAQTREVAAKRTPLSVGEIRSALASAHVARFGRPASAATLDVLTAQVAHETARGERMFNYNFGGIKGASPAGTTARYTTHEVLGGADVKLVDGFRAYATPAQGASDYLALLDTRYKGAMAAAERGDVTGFASALKDRGYYTAPLADYSAALRHLAHEARSPGAVHAAPRAIEPTNVAIDAATPASELPTTLELVRVLDAVAAMSARIGAPTTIDESSNAS
jgi:flagellar protein FlgJ